MVLAQFAVASLTFERVPMRTKRPHSRSGAGFSNPCLRKSWRQDRKYQQGMTRGRQRHNSPLPNPPPVSAEMPSS
jgi:hypothetical protein